MIKKLLYKLHLILGLVSGIIVFIVSVTGALYAFKDEIESLTLSYKKVSPQNQEMILPSRVFEIGEELTPDKEIHGIIYRSPEDALEIVYYQAEPFYYGAAYLNPYSGELLKSVDFMKTFFGSVRRGHGTLWLPMKLGYTIVALGTLIFVILLITGIVLWWPRKNSSSKSFSFTKGKKSGFRRLEYHKVIGFYVSFLALLIALTGLSWLIKELDLAMYKAMGGEKDIEWKAAHSSLHHADSIKVHGNPVDLIYKRIRKEYPEMQFVEIHAIETDSSAILVELNREPSSYRKVDYLHFDQYTLEPIESNNFYGAYDDAKTADKIKRSYYDIHTGNILGFPGKVLAFLVSLFCASLPVTGFMLWWKRRKEKKAFVNKIDI